jgi:hypothetical protein
MLAMHFRGNWIWVAVAVAVSALFVSRARAAPGPALKLEYQVAALETLQQFDLSPDQLRAIQKLASSVKPAKVADHVKISDEYRNALSEYRKALLTGDEDKIADAEDKVSDIRDKDENATEPDIDATESAREAAPKLLAILHPSQVASYISEHSDDVPDPVQTMIDALDEGEGKTGDDYASIKSEAADQVAVLLAGIDPKAQEPIAKKVSDWIDSNHKLSADELKNKRQSLEASAKEIVKQPDPIECLRHWLERDLADLLSNPELSESLSSRLKGS